MKKKIIAISLLFILGLTGCMKDANVNNTKDAEPDYQSSNVLQKDETVPAEVKVTQETENTVAEDEKIVEASETTGAVDKAADTETDEEYLIYEKGFDEINDSEE